MYETFFGLRERPFELTPNPRFLFISRRHREALVNLEFGIASRKGILVLIGEPGTGKTTVARALMARRSDVRTKYIYLNHSVVSPAELRQFLARSLGLSRAAEGSNTELIHELTQQLTTLRQSGRGVALFVDEAQTLSRQMLEEVRLLSNVETNEAKLLTLVLIGQPKLAERLNDEAWKQVKQRVELRSTLTTFDLTETAAYILSRIRTAGGDVTRLFTAEAVRLIHERSGGYARSINVICENALMSGFAEQQQPVTRRLVQQVCDEFDLHAQPAQLATPPTLPVASTFNLRTPEPVAAPTPTVGRRWPVPAPVEPADLEEPASTAPAPKRRWSLLSRVGGRS